MADAPKVQRRRRRRQVRNNGSAAPTADSTPSGVAVTTIRSTPRRRRRSRRVRLVNQPLVEENVVTSVAGGRRFRRRGLTRFIKKELKREGLEGPKVSVQQKITSTFGMIGPNSSGNVELELNFFLHPSLAKEANDGTAFGPLQALAAQYSLWKIKYLTLRFTPMVGASAVSGTVVRASLNLSQSPGGSNWSGLGTRLHMDMHPGQVATFHLRGDQVGGPRDGGWWFTDTNEEGSQSAGPIVEVHTLGKTESTFQDKDWKGPLFLVEGIGLWQFANYQVKPALGSLERREGETSAQILASAGQPITMELDSTAAVTMFMDMADPEQPAPAAVATNQSVGETIFQIVDVGASLAQRVAPPPFGWLIKGGWWFVKKILGRTRSGKSAFMVYASLQDAQNNKPAVATASLDSTSPINTELMVTQINSPNVGPNPYITGTPRAGPQVLQPGDAFKLSSSMLTELFIRVPDGNTPSMPVSVPVCAIPGVLRNATGAIIAPATASGSSFIQTPWWIGVPGSAPGTGAVAVQPQDYVPTTNKGGYIHSLYRLIDPRFTDQSGFFEFLEPAAVDNGVNFCVLNNFGGGTTSSGAYTPGPGTGIATHQNPYAVYGKVVATSRVWSGTEPKLDMVFSLIRITNSLRFGNDNVRDMVLAIGDTANQVQFALAPPVTTTVSNNTWAILERDIPIDSYLLGVSYTNEVGNVNGVNIPTTLIMGKYSRVESTWSPIFPYNLSGQMLPPTSISLNLEYVEYHPPSEDLIRQLRTLNVSFTIPSSHVPTLESVEEEPELEISSDSGASEDSVERFCREVGDEMIEFPRRWLNDPGFSKYLE